MKNKIQLISYIDRFGDPGIQNLHQLLNDQFEGVIGGVHLLPFYYPIDGADAGYDPIDHTQVDHRFGNWEDVSAMSQDFDLMADMIVNHMSGESEEFQDVIKNGSSSAYFDLFLNLGKVFPKGISEDDILKIYRPRPNLPFTIYKLDTGEKYLFWTTFTANQLDIDVKSTAGKKYLEAILDAFAKNGISMIRLDAAGYAIKKAGTDCFMLPETYEFIDELAKEAKSKGMEVLVEIHSYFQDQIKIAEKVDYVYDFALPPLVLHSLYTGDFKALKDWLEVSPRNCITVLDTHDGIGVIDVARAGEKLGLLADESVDNLVKTIHEKSKGGSLKATGAAASNLDLYQVNCTYYDALGQDDLHYIMARAIQFFVPGVPQVYYAGLLARENDLELLAQTQVGRDINRPYLSTEQVLADIQRPVVQVLMKLAKFRNTHAAFDGAFGIGRQPDDVLQLQWVNGNQSASLFINVNQSELVVTYTEADGTEVVLDLKLPNE